MGNCTSSKNILSTITNNFINYNILDNEYKIIVGIYPKSNDIFNSTQEYEGIYIGKFDNNKIYKLKFGMYRNENKMIELYFENNIKLILISESVHNVNSVKLILTFNDIRIEKYICNKILKKIKPTNDGKNYVDLILKII